jgi:TonB family protein
MAKTGRFWRNVVLIALVHVALIAVMIRWSLAARASTNAESIVWLGGAEDFTAGKENEVPPAAKQATPPVEAKPSRDNEADSDKPVVTTAKSEIELSSATPKPKPTPTAASTPKPIAMPTPKPKATPKPIPKPTPKKTLVAKASPKPSPKAKMSAVKSSEKLEKNKKSTLAKTGQQGTAVSSPPTSSAGKGGHAGGGSSTSEFGWYGNMLHDRFYSAWIQPTTNVSSDSKFSTLVKVRIEKDGHVSNFEIIKPSGNVVVNESVRVVAKQVTQVDPLPAGLIKGDHYDVKINFELNTAEPGER